MAKAIVKSLAAERDLVELFDNIAIDAGVGRAEAVLRRIEKTMDTLSQFPLIGRVRRDLAEAPRVFTVWPWLVFYEPRRESDGIAVLRVLDGRRDLPNLFEENGGKR